VQKYLNVLRVDEIFTWLAKEIKEVRNRVNVKELVDAFDRGIQVMEALVDKVSVIPFVGKKAKAALDQVTKVRLHLDAGLASGIERVQDVFNTIIKALEAKALENRYGILDAANIHFRGAIPEAQALALMRKRKPAWLSKTGDKFIDSATLVKYRAKIDSLSAKVDAMGKPVPVAERFPYLSDQSIQSFHELTAYSIKGPARLFRILAPNSRGMSDCWISKEVFDRLQNSPNPKEAWRRFLAVWPDWNVNGQFVTYDIKAGETLNVWRGVASSQKKDALPGRHLEGGWEQIVFSLARGDTRADYAFVLQN